MAFATLKTAIKSETVECNLSLKSTVMMLGTELVRVKQQAFFLGLIFVHGSQNKWRK